VFEVTITQTFSAAHRLKESGGTCEKLHGHNFTVEVSISSPALNDAGMVIDFKIVKEWTGEILKELDHRYLNELSYFNSLSPSAENLAIFFYERISAKTKIHNLGVTRVTVWESEETRASYSETFAPFEKI
jgi:6-pyruvoyltetrahydropterin/6-carboxytetrahydropterin synthase